MAKYVLGPEGARKFRELCAAKSADGRRGGAGPAPVFAVEFAAPYTVRWAASLASDETSEGAGDGTEGEWIIWLPTSGLLKVGQATVDITSDLDDAGGDYPEGWYKLGDALDADDGGTLYLNVTLGNTPSAEFSDTAGGASNPVSIKICEASVGSDGARTVRQFVTSVLVIGATGEDHDTITTADEKSISREYVSSGDGAAVSHFSNIVQIKGFGRFKPDPEQHPNDVRGTFVPSGDMELSEYGPTDVAFVVRTGNTNTVDANAVAYKRLKLKGVEEPFKYTETIEVDEQTGDPTVVRVLANCQFWHGGDLRTLADVPVVSSGTYYLNIVGQQNATTGEMTWTYAVSTTPATSGHLFMAVPLYRIGNDLRPEADFRTASLSCVLPNRPILFNDTLIAHVYADDDIDIGTKRILAGPGIDVDDDGDTITISALLALAAGPGILISNGVIAANPDGNSIAFTSGSGNARRIQLAGFNAPGSNAADVSLGRALAQATSSSARYVLAAIPYNGAYYLKYMPLDQLAIEAAPDSGLEFTATQDGNGRPVLRLDWPGRQSGDTVELHDLTVYGSNGTAETVVKVPATDDIEIPGVKGGRGVTVTSDDNGATRKIDADIADVQSDSEGVEITRDEDGVVHISLSGEGSGGGDDTAYTGSLKVATNMEYNTSTHKFVATYLTFQVNNGLIMANPTTSTADVFTAVEETV